MDINQEYSKKKELSVEEVRKNNLDLNDMSILDSLRLDKKSYNNGLIKFIIGTAIALFVFFWPITINGETDMVFGVIYNSMINLFGNFGLAVITLITVATAITSFYGKFIARPENIIYKYFDGDSKIHPFLYTLGAILTSLYTLNYLVPGFSAPGIIVGSSTGGTVVPDILVPVFWIIVVSAFFLPFLLNYGFIDFVGAFFEPLMRPIWKVPGRSAVNAIASFVSSSSVGVLITSKLYNEKVYTEKEAVLIATGFSAVSIGFAYMVIKTAGLQDQFILVYGSSLLITLIVSAVIARIPPFSTKKDVYLDGREQTEEDLKAIRTKKGKRFKTALDRAVKKAHTSESLLTAMKASLIDGLMVVPKVLTLIGSIGISALIIAEVTPVFDILGKIFVPLLNLLRVPDVAEIAASFPVGIAEMFLPVLLIADKVSSLSIGARYMVTAVSIVQIIFFAETIVVMMASRLPLKLWELIVVFLERTFIGIIIAALFMHVLF